MDESVEKWNNTATGIETECVESREEREAWLWGLVDLWSQMPTRDKDELLCYQF